MMKAICLFFSLLFVTASSFAINDYSSGDELYIWATSGLNMRSAPDAKAEKVGKIPFGSQVKVVDTEPKAHPFKYTMVRAQHEGKEVKWTVNGYWVKVDFDGQQGYVFDAYLGKFAVVTDGPDHHPDLNLELLKAYGKDNWGGLDQEKKETTLNYDSYSVDPDKGRSDKFTLTFKNGSYYETASESFSGHTALFIKDISLEEAYLIFNALTGYEFQQKKNDITPISTLKLMEHKKGVLQFEGEMNYVVIKAVDGGYRIEMGGGC